MSDLAIPGAPRSRTKLAAPELFPIAVKKVKAMKELGMHAPPTSKTSQCFVEAAGPPKTPKKARMDTPLPSPNTPTRTKPRASVLTRTLKTLAQIDASNSDDDGSGSGDGDADDEDDEEEPLVGPLFNKTGLPGYVPLPGQQAYYRGGHLCAACSNKGPLARELRGGASGCRGGSFSVCPHELELHVQLGQFTYVQEIGRGCRVRITTALLTSLVFLLGAHKPIGDEDEVPEDGVASVNGYCDLRPLPKTGGLFYLFCRTLDTGDYCLAVHIGRCHDVSVPVAIVGVTSEYQHDLAIQGHYGTRCAVRLRKSSPCFLVLNETVVKLAALGYLDRSAGRYRSGHRLAAILMVGGLNGTQRGVWLHNAGQHLKERGCRAPPVVWTPAWYRPGKGGGGSSDEVWGLDTMGAVVNADERQYSEGRGGGARGYLQPDLASIRACGYGKIACGCIIAWHCKYKQQLLDIKHLNRHALLLILYLQDANIAILCSTSVLPQVFGLPPSDNSFNSPAHGVSTREEMLASYRTQFADESGEYTHLSYDIAWTRTPTTLTPTLMTPTEMPELAPVEPSTPTSPTAPVTPVVSSAPITSEPIERELPSVQAPFVPTSQAIEGPLVAKAMHFFTSDNAERHQLWAEAISGAARESAGKARQRLWTELELSADALSVPAHNVQIISLEGVRDVLCDCRDGSHSGYSRWVVYTFKDWEGNIIIKKTKTSLRKVAGAGNLGGGDVEGRRQPSTTQQSASSEQPSLEHVTSGAIKQSGAPLRRPLMFEHSGSKHEQWPPASPVPNSFDGKSDPFTFPLSYGAPERTVSYPAALTGLAQILSSGIISRAES
ncbi:hypothetical protein C8R43DRAFT_954497 [Mycena crocata]|nr:hypothetical protein C8R43DRAFT_954497 [Mycena crocata]